MSHDPRADVAAALARCYGLDIVSLTPGPRQLVADTFIAVTGQGRRYFCKATFKQGFIPAIVASLEAMEQLHELLPDRVCHPARTTDNALHVRIPGGILVVLDFVAGETSYDYSYATFGAVTARIHEATQQITCTVPTQSFSQDAEADFVVERFETARRYSGADAALGELRVVARRRADRFRRLAEIHRAATERCMRSAPALVMTHGDAPGNVLVRSAEDFTIIDWDEGMLAPAERDLWVLEHEPDVLDGYRTVHAGFTVDPDARLHSILRYMFMAARAYLQEYEAAPTKHVRHAYLSGLDDLLDGWMSRVLAAIERGA